MKYTQQKNEIILEQAQELYNNRLNKQKKSFDINDLDVSFARGLTLEDGASTLTDFTADIIGDELNQITSKLNNFLWFFESNNRKKFRQNFCKPKSKEVC